MNSHNYRVTIIYSLIILIIGISFAGIFKFKFYDADKTTSNYHVETEFCNQSLEENLGAILILENSTSWRNRNQLILLDTLTQLTQQKLKNCNVVSATTMEAPYLFGLSILNRNPIRDSDFNPVKLDRYSDIYSKFISPDGKYALLYLNNCITSNDDVLKLETSFGNFPQINHEIISEDHKSQAMAEDSKMNILRVSAFTLILMVICLFTFIRSWKLIFAMVTMLLLNLSFFVLLLNLFDIAITTQLTTIPGLIIILSMSDMIHLSYAYSRTTESEKMSTLQRLNLPLILTSISNSIGFFAFLILSDDHELIKLSWLAILATFFAFFSARFIFIHLIETNVVYFRSGLEKFVTDKIESLKQKSILHTKRTRLFALFISIFLLIWSINFLPYNLAGSGDVDLSGTKMEMYQILQRNFFGNCTVELSLHNKQRNFLSHSSIQKTNGLESFINESFQPLYLDSYLLVLKRFNRFRLVGKENAFILNNQFDFEASSLFNGTKNLFGWSEFIHSNEESGTIKFGFYSVNLSERVQRYRTLSDYIQKNASNQDFSIIIQSNDYEKDRSEFGLIKKIGIGFVASFILTAIFIGFKRKSLVIPFYFVLVNILPLLLAIFGMYLFHIPINTYSMFLLTLLVGLCLDDSIYLLLNKKTDGATNIYFPILITSMILGVGFFGYVASVYQWMRPLGIILFISLTVALLCDVLILPTQKNHEN